VPNFSEGRDAAVIKAIGRALAERAELLDVHTDADHNRTVFTLIGEDAEVVDALVAGIAVARDRIDLRRHDGVHPRIGVADVVPIVPIRPEDMGRARAASLEPRRIGRRSGCRCSSMGRPEGAGRRSSGVAVRRAPRRIDAGELAPDFGPSLLDPAAGGAIVGARRPLIAFNVNLVGANVDAGERSRRWCERDGGFPVCARSGSTFRVPAGRR
jgi:glutamate formiminotransferase